MLSNEFKNKLAQSIDHTLLKPQASEKELEKLCLEAKENHFFSVCVNSSRIEFVKKELQNSHVKVCAVVGFPLGAMDKIAKGFETKRAVELGADEIDMVLNIGMLKEGNHLYVQNDIEEVVKNAAGKKVKVILETCLLTDDEIILACKLALNAKAHFVKTSTGFSTDGATLHAVKLMKSIVQDKMEIKASGGIRDLKTAQDYLELGVTRLGTSSGVQILNGLKVESSY